MNHQIIPFYQIFKLTTADLLQNCFCVNIIGKLKTEIQVSKHNSNIVLPDVIKLCMGTSLRFKRVGQNVTKLLESLVRSFNALPMIQVAVQKAK